MKFKGKKLRCECCGTRNNLTRDHIIPKSNGTTLLNNKQILCKKCNQAKGVLIINYSKKMIELEPYMFALNNKGLRLLFTDTYHFGCNLRNPNFRNRLKEFVR
jgi:hypothetical protein